MATVFSHIIQTRFSQVSEDVATEALAYILHTSEATRVGLSGLLRAVVPELPTLRFCTQQSQDGSRPDMWGYDERGPRVFLENKFWAGLTDNQPVNYLRLLAEIEYPSVLLVVAPSAREETLWRELARRLHAADIAILDAPSPGVGIVRCARTALGPALALTSWTRLLAALELHAAEDAAACGDLRQLRALCEAADSAAFTPLAASALSDQRTPALIRQLSDLTQRVVEVAITASVLDIAGLRPTSNWLQIGRYARFTPTGVGAWLGIHFGLWAARGGTPLWLLFADTAFSRATDVRHVLEPWAATRGVHAVFEGDTLALELTLITGEEQDAVVRGLVAQLQGIGHALASLPPKPLGAVDND